MAGVLQGDTLASSQFTIVVDYCMKLTLEKHPGLLFSLQEANATKLSNWQH